MKERKLPKREAHVTRQILSLTIRYQKIEPRTGKVFNVRSRTFSFAKKQKVKE